MSGCVDHKVGKVKKLDKYFIERRKKLIMIKDS